jgi:GTP-binding protein YchF
MASLEIGILGLPNVGKTTVFNALTRAGAAVTAYAATSSSANVGVAPVPDRRLDALAVACSSRETIPASVQFVDVAGLVRGAGKGGGLGGEFLGHLRAVDAILHVVRTFPDEDVFHVDGSVDPVRDAEAVDIELVLADGVIVERRLERQAKAARVGLKEAKDELGALERLAAHLDGGAPARTFAEPIPDGLDLLTVKPVLYVANTSEDGDGEAVAALRAYAAQSGADVVEVAGRFEADLAEIDDDEERAAFLAEIGQEEAGMPRVASAAFRLLDLIQFFTVGPKEARAWPLGRGSTAVEAAGKIHTDIARGFIRAEVIGWEDMVACGGSHAEAQKRGLMRVEGRDYVVEDGEVINIRFNV